MLMPSQPSEIIVPDKHSAIPCLHCCQIESGAVVAAGAVVGKGVTVPSGEVWGGNPLKFLRAVKPDEASFFEVTAASASV